MSLSPLSLLSLSYCIRYIVEFNESLFIFMRNEKWNRLQLINLFIFINGRLMQWERIRMTGCKIERNWRNG